MATAMVNRFGGPKPKFTEYHLWKTLMLADEEKPVGRKKLAEMLGIGEGSTRTIISLLRDQNYVVTERSGVLLTAKGGKYKSTIFFEVAPVKASDVTINTCDCAVRIAHAAKRVSYGCEERDVAIKAGATGATTLVCRNGSLVFPGSDYPVSDTIEKVIRDRFRVKNDDVIIIGTADNLEDAECGAVSAALNIIGGINTGKGLKDIMSSRSTASELLSLAFAVHDLIGGYPVCAKSRDNLGIRIENGVVIDNAYTGEVLEEVLGKGTTIRRIALSGPYKGTKVIVTPIEIDGRTVAAIGVVDLRDMASGNRMDIFRD